MPEKTMKTKESRFQQEGLYQNWKVVVTYEKIKNNSDETNRTSGLDR